MKMAKASEKDIEAAGRVMQIFDQIDQGDYPANRGDDDAPEEFDPDNFNHLRHFYDLIKSSLDNTPNWHGRVIGGMCYVILWDKNEIVNPDADVLELHPKIAKALTDAKRYEYILENMVVMSETGSRAFVGREEIEPYVVDAMCSQIKPIDTVPT